MFSQPANFDLIILIYVCFMYYTNVLLCTLVISILLLVLKCLSVGYQYISVNSALVLVYMYRWKSTRQ